MSLNKIVSKLFKYKILFMDILTFLGLDYRNVSLMTLYLDVIGVIIQKKNKMIITHKKHKNGNNYRVATLAKSFLTVIGIIMQSLKSI